MFKYFTHVGKHQWYNVLQKFVDGYNKTKHRTIGMTPSEAYENKMEDEVFLRQEERIQTKKKEKPVFKFGDYVRLSKAKQLFEKSFHSNWTEEIFRVIAFDTSYMPIMYTIESLEHEPIEGRFYKFELQKVKKPKDFAISKIMRKKGGKALVKFIGYKQPTWVNITDIKNING